MLIAGVAGNAVKTTDSRHCGKCSVKDGGKSRGKL
jgi:hypothetical protein